MTLTDADSPQPRPHFERPCAVLGEYYLTSIEFSIRVESGYVILGIILELIRIETQQRFCRAEDDAHQALEISKALGITERMLGYKIFKYKI